MPSSRVRPLLIAALTALAAFAALAAAPVGAQVPERPPAEAPARTDSLTEVRLRDGSVLYGRVERADGDSLVLRTGAGVRVAVPAAEVERQRTVIGRIVRGAFWPADPNGTRLLFSATGRALRRGEGYVSAYFLFFPFVGVGVTDRFTIAAGTPIVPGAIGEVFYVAPKLTLFERPRSSYAIGAISFAVTDQLDAGTVGLAYGVGTWGDRDGAVSAGAGWAYRWGDGDDDVANSPVIMLGGETRTGRRTKLITENWIFSGNDELGVIFSAGVRLLGDRFSGDLGLAGAAGWGDAGCCLPLVNIVWTFGR